MNLQIKDASVAQIPLIQELTEQIWRPTYESILTPEQISYMLDMMYSTTSLTRQISEQGHRFILLYDEARPIGFAAYSTTDTDGIQKLHKIYLHSDYQGKRVGKFFMEAVIDRVKAAGAHTLELDVNRHNKARLFYERQGFTILKEKDTHIGNGYEMNDYVMRKAL
ncbi:GNAT family N-acetyltransferase [Chitinophaga agrisoli]|uniref:GNAT family N-acetyltransferase n=1 Tax=Chitinophaga agrisoli TaxID=2607653 RepID=A0A5B2VTQ5_9BACT|nr:GNAT family N-acetyltransferase [Chitinophaga agrisoli]KAA2241988.1 GNAT family N-acetyltransferase [Chitinophaga agrisoli]